MKNTLSTLLIASSLTFSPVGAVKESTANELNQLLTFGFQVMERGGHRGVIKQEIKEVAEVTVNTEEICHSIDRPIEGSDVLVRSELTCEERVPPLK